MKKRERITFSVDLLEAARRSTGKLSGIDDEARKAVLERYKNFWRLAKQYPGQPLAPATDIDEMWHLHMLHPAVYAADCHEYFGAILDHNPAFGHDRQEKMEFRRICDATDKLWKEHFKESYASNAVIELADCSAAVRGIKPEQQMG